MICECGRYFANGVTTTPYGFLCDDCRNNQEQLDRIHMEWQDDPHDGSRVTEGSGTAG